MAKERGVDSKCIELARHFLSDLATADESDVAELSRRIQDAVEDFCNVTFNIPDAP